jgi:hypothetical protein
MAEHDGKLFCSTLPSGRVFSFQAGRNVTAGRSISAAWHHIAAVRSHDRLALYIDGELVGESAPFDASEFNLDAATPIKIGFGANDYFAGRLSDLRLYRRALNAGEIRELAR